MHVLAISHAVEDYDKWKAVYDTMRPTSIGGAKYASVNRNIDDDNVVVVIAGFESLDALNKFVGDPRIEDASSRSRIIGQPRVEIYEEVEVNDSRI